MRQIFHRQLLTDNINRKAAVPAPDPAALLLPHFQAGIFQYFLNKYKRHFTGCWPLAGQLPPALAEECLTEPPKRLNFKVNTPSLACPQSSSREISIPAGGAPTSLQETNGAEKVTADGTNLMRADTQQFTIPLLDTSVLCEATIPQTLTTRCQKG